MTGRSSKVNSSLAIEGIKEMLRKCKINQMDKRRVIRHGEKDKKVLSI